MNILKKGYIFCLRYRAHWSMLGLWFVVIVLSTIMALSPLSQRVVVYNSKHTIDLFSAQLAETHLAPEKIEALSKRFSRVLEETVQTYAASHHVVILKPSSVIVSNEDITPVIEKLLTLNMRKENK